MRSAAVAHGTWVGPSRADDDDLLQARRGGAEEREEGVRRVADADDVGAELLRGDVRFSGGERKGRGKEGVGEEGGEGKRGKGRRRK